MLAGGQVVGLTTSGAFGHRTGRAFAFAYIERHALESRVLLTVSMLGRDESATILNQAAYDPANVRLRG